MVHQDTKHIHSHADLTGKRVGIVSGSVAIGSQEQRAVSFKTREELLENFVAKNLDAALVEDDFAAWYLHWHPNLPLRQVPEYAPRERWNMGFAVRSEDKTLLAELNRELTNVVESGQLNRLYAEQGVAYRAAFSSVKEKQVLSNSWQHIQERGELVVSFDPANLPYSRRSKTVRGSTLNLAKLLPASWASSCESSGSTSNGKPRSANCSTANAISLLALP